MCLHPAITYGDQALASQPVVRHPALGRQGPGQVPVGLAAQPGTDRLAFAPQLQQVANPGAGFATYIHVGRPSGQPAAVQNRSRQFCAPLFPVAHPHPSSQPAVQFGDRAVVVGDAEIAHPATDILGEFLEPVFHRHAPVPAGQASEMMAEKRVLPFAFAELN